jgi:lysophospholipase L1-like esterase
VDRLGYAKVSYTFSPRFIASLDPTIVKVGIGGLLESEGQISIGRLRNIQLSALSSGIAIHNQGVSYTSVAEGLATIGKVIRWQPVVCIVAYGTNDIRNGVSREDYYADLLQLVNILREHKIFPIIATLPPLGDDQVNCDKVPAWNEYITVKAHELNIGLWDRWQAFDNGNLSFIEDGRHPTRDGYLRLGENVVRFFI